MARDNEDYSDLALPAAGYEDDDYSDLAQPAKKKQKVNIEDLFSPKMGTPASSLMQQGIEVGKNPVGRIGLEAVAGVPFGLAEAPAAILSRTAGMKVIPKYLAEMLGVTAKGTAFGEALGQIPNSPDDKRSIEEKAKEALIPSVVAGALTKPLGDIIGSVRPSRLFRGKASPETLARNLETTEGTHTGLGDVVESPFLKRQYENVLSKIPLTGANEAMQKTAQQVEDKGYNLLDKFLGDHSPENVNEILYKDLNKNFLKHQNQKNAFYKNADKIAEETGLKLSAPTFAKQANKYSDAIEATNMLKYDPDVKSIYNKLQKYKQPNKVERNVGELVDKEGKPLIDEAVITPPTLKEANILKGKLNQFAKQAASSPDPAQRNAARIFGDLGKSLKTDIESSIESHGHEPLKKAYKDAEENYKKNFSSFLDKHVYKFIGGNADPDMFIANFLKTGPTADRSRVLESAAKTLSTDKKRNLLTYGYLSRALDNEGTLNPSKLGTLIKKLRPNQFKALVPSESLRRELANYSKLTSMNAKPLNLMHNPATGQQNLDVLSSLLLNKGLHGVIGGTEGYHQGGLPGAVAGAISGVAIPGLMGKGLTKWLTSPGVRESMIQKMLNPRAGSSSHYLQGLAELLANQQQGSE